MSSHASGGRCLACGKASTLRCSSCTNKGGIDLFFCSRAHQKLVWPYHRLVCGERAHPFRLPVYSQEEADVLLERLREPANTPELRSLQEKMRAAVEAHNADESNLKEKIQSLVGQEGSLAQDPQPASDSQSAKSLIRELRLLSWDWYVEAYPAGGEPPLQHFVEHMTEQYDHVMEGAPPVALESVWHSCFCHHFAASMPIQARASRFMDPALSGSTDTIPLEEVRRFPGAAEAILQVCNARRTLNKFLEDAQGTEYAAFANVAYCKLTKTPDFFTGGS